MIKCPTCQKEFPSEEFQKKSGGKRHAYCKSCKLSYDKEYYKNNVTRRVKQRQYNAKSLERNRRLVWDYLSENPCVDCGEPDPIVLEFDHVRADKVMEVGKMVDRLLSVEKIMEEISKCEVRCANCHRRVTHQRADTWKNKESTKLS